MVTCEATPLAVVRFSCAQAELGERIRAELGRSSVYAYLKEAGVSFGLNTFTYRCRDGVLDVEMGVQVASPIAGNGDVVASFLPAGKALVCRYWGDYSGLAMAYSALGAAVSELGRASAGLDWEVYGHWADDPAERVTDVYRLVS